MLVYLLLLAVFLIFIHILFNYNKRARMLSKIPGPPGYFIFGNGPEIIVSSVDLMEIGRIWSKKWKTIHKFWAFPVGAINIYNPEDIEIIVSSLKFNEKSIIYSLISPWLREGLLLSKGEKWHQRRKLLTPAFHFNILQQFFIVLEENSHRLVQKLDRFTGDSVDIVSFLSEFTLHSICETAMGTKLSEEVSGTGKKYKEAIYDLGKIILYRFMRTYLFNDFLFSLTSASKKMKEYLKVILSFTERVIDDRRRYINKYGVELPKDDDNDDGVVYKKKKKTAMLDLLLLAENEGLIDAAGIQEEVDTFMFEGHDTTASGLTFCLLSLANNKTIQDKVYAELQDIFGESSRPVTMEDLTKMKYLEMCIKESLRLYPPVHFISRQLHESVVLSGYEVPGNVMCNIQILDLHRNPALYKDPLVFDPDRFLPENIAARHPYAYIPFSAGPRNCIGGYEVPGNVMCNIQILDLHRNPALYKDPLVFDPDRFLPENIAARHPYAYIPFSAGPRNCIGQKFAMMEMKTAVSQILRKFVLMPVTRHEDVEFMADLVLRNTRPVQITFVSR